MPSHAAEAVDFARDIQPILEARCHACHGPEKQRADLRLDFRSRALQGGESGPALVPGKSAESLLIRLVTGEVADKIMPAKGERLSAAEIAKLRAWIDAGAPWPESGPSPDDAARSHWSFQPVHRPEVPAAANEGMPLHPIDAFLRAGLKAKGLDPSPEAPKVALIRRLHWVIRGLPPTPGEVAAFEADTRPDAFEREVDKVLADPAYGERWARHWLDLIRFAESNGFETNRERLNAWKFRDYIIAAFNEDKPYDRFIREQIAGDALGVPVATGFLVGGPVDIVGSPDPSLTLQQRADELDDMVNTTGTAFLGLTLGCARCHSHKFDPVSHKEYHGLAAIFSGVKHGDRAEPRRPEDQARLDKLDAEIASLEKRLESFILRPPTNGSVAGGKMRPAVNARENVEQLVPVESRWIRFTILDTSGAEPCIDELEVWSGTNNVALASRGTKASASGTLPGYEIHKLEHINDGRVGNARSWISNESGKGWIVLELPRPERVDRIVWARDRSGMLGDRVVTRYRIESALKKDEWTLIASSDDREPYQGGGKPPAIVYRFDGLPEAQAAEGRRWLARLEESRKERQEAARSPMIYAGNFSQPGPTRRLHRGDPMQPRENIPPGTLGIFRPLELAADTPEQERRVKLADWIASPENPLTARVIVNRLWQFHFGVGLVDTPSDFGRNGSRPSHPALLDWLASELVARGWSLKAIQREILLSAAWRQSSAPREEALKVDASSRWIWRFPPRRLEAEAIRDGMLTVSGALDPKRGGPSFYLHDVDRENVYHYHPKEQFGPPDMRRMVYAFKVRMEQDGVFGSFDCPDGSLVMPKRTLSTTPLQALNLYNSRFVLDQTEAFARRLGRECADGGLRDQVLRAWQLAYTRHASKREADEAVQFAQSHGVPALCRAILNSNEFLFIP